MDKQMVGGKVFLVVFLSLKVVHVLVLGNSVDPNELPHYMVFHVGLHCLSKYVFRSH